MSAREFDDLREVTESDRRDVAAWLLREADQRVRYFPQRRDGVDALMRHLAAIARGEVSGVTLAADREPDALRAAVEALAADDDLMFRMGCIEHEVEAPDQISDSLRRRLTMIAAEETRCLAAALAAHPAADRESVDVHACETRIGDLCPACLRKPCVCPVDDTAMRDIFERLAAHPATEQPEVAP